MSIKKGTNESISLRASKNQASKQLLDLKYDSKFEVEAKNGEMASTALELLEE